MTATTTTIRRSTGHALRVVGLATVLALGLAAPGQADQLAPQPEPTPTASIEAEPHCEHNQGPGIAFQTSLHPEPEDGNQVVPLARYRPAGGGEATTVSGPADYMETGVGDFEVQAVYHQPPLVQKGVINPVVHPGGTWASDWVPVTVTCVDPEDEPEDEDEDGPEDDPGGGSNDGSQVLDDVVVATPNFTG
jgi:hypothetical protein